MGAGTHEPAVSETCEVLGHRRLRQAKVVDKIDHAMGSKLQVTEDLQPGWVTECSKQARRDTQVTLRRGVRGRLDPGIHRHMPMLSAATDIVDIAAAMLILRRTSAGRRSTG